jgi:hypothetical protein
MIILKRVLENMLQTEVLSLLMSCSVTVKKLEERRERKPEQLHDYLPLKKTTDLTTELFR